MGEVILGDPVALFELSCSRRGELSCCVDGCVMASWSVFIKEVIVEDLAEVGKLGSLRHGERSYTRRGARLEASYQSEAIVLAAGRAMVLAASSCVKASWGGRCINASYLARNVTATVRCRGTGGCRGPSTLRCRFRRRFVEAAFRARCVLLGSALRQACRNCELAALRRSRARCVKVNGRARAAWCELRGVSCVMARRVCGASVRVRIAVVGDSIFVLQDSFTYRCRLL
jgi:hypothetical protein